MSDFALSNAALDALLIETATHYRNSALRNVAAIAFHGLRHGVNGGKRADMVALFMDRNGANLTQSTAYRQVGFGFKIAATVKAKCADHAAIVAAKAAPDGEAMVTSMLAFFCEMGISDAKDGDAWTGAPLSAEAKAELRQPKAKPEAAPKATVEPKAEGELSEAEAAAKLEALNAAVKAKAQEAAQTLKDHAESVAAETRARAAEQAEFEARLKAEAFQHVLATLDDRSDAELAAMVKAVQEVQKSRKAMLKAAA